MMHDVFSVELLLCLHNCPVNSEAIGMFLTIHLYENGSKPPGHFLSCILFYNKRTRKNEH